MYPTHHFAPRFIPVPSRLEALDGSSPPRRPSSSPRFLSALFTICLWLFAFSCPLLAQYAGGSGAPTDPYLIATAEQMQAVGAHPEHWGLAFKLTADLDLSAYDGQSGRPAFNIIGTDYYHQFSGAFDGNGHSIANFTWTLAASDGVALFGYVGGVSAFVRNLTLLQPNVSVNNTDYVAVLVRTLDSGALHDCRVEGGAVSGRGCVAPLVAYCFGTVSSCSSTSTVSGSSSVGGLVGYNSGAISGCSATGSVSSIGSYVGGLVGHSSGAVSDSYATGFVSSTGACVGGLVGYNSGAVSRCYASGGVSGWSDVGGLVGYGDGGTVQASFWDTQTSAQTWSAGGAGKTTAQMMTQSTFTAAAWDFTTPVWTICEGFDYPRLAWQHVSCFFPFAGGAGTPADPYLIAATEHMQAVGAFPAQWSKHFRLTADLDLSAYDGQSGRPPFNIIGNDSTNFSGAFDGNGHTIANFTWFSTGQNYIGFFGYVSGASAQIKNLTLLNANVSAGTGRYVGALVGYLKGGTLAACASLGGSVSGYYNIGGLVGHNDHGALSTSYATGNVSGSSQVGGLVGHNYYGAVSNSYATGAASGINFVGGLLGYSESATISSSYAAGAVSASGNDGGGLVGTSNHNVLFNCYATGPVAGSQSVGGLLGDSHDSWVSGCYAAGKVAASHADAGGLVGTRDYTSNKIIACFWDVHTTGQTASVAGIGLTTALMQTVLPFSLAGWGCAAVWTVAEGRDYPRLAWQNLPGQPIPCGDYPYGGGAGEPTNPYLVQTVEHWQAFCFNWSAWNKHFKLMADLDLAALGTDGLLASVGSFDAPFSGVFDGNGHTLANFTWSSTARDCIGLFGYVSGATAQIKNLAVLNPNVNAGTGSSVAALVGALYSGAVTACTVLGGDIQTDFNAGGLVGYNAGTISDSCSSARVQSNTHTGGLVGLSDGQILRSYAGGIVSGGVNVGGLLGYNRNLAAIANCYAAGPVSGANYVGGLLGYNQSTAVSSCYASGPVSGASNIGGLVGYSSGGAVAASFWDTLTTGQTTSAAGIGLTTAQMQSANTFLNAAWGCAAVWTVDEGRDFPRLAWQNLPGQLLSSCVWPGRGTPEDPFLVATPAQMQAIGAHPEYWGLSFKLIADLDLSAYDGKSGRPPFDIIGNDSTNFSGAFDGNGHAISHFLWTSTSRYHVGIFGDVSGAQIKNLTLIDPVVNGGLGRGVAPLVGALYSGAVTACTVRGGAIQTDYNAGGLVGYNGGAISDSCSSARVSSNTYTGGLVGFSDGQILRSYAGGIVAGSVNVGGLLGYNRNPAAIANCYAAGPVSGSNCVGGLLGYNDSGAVSNCYAAGPVSGASNVGGLIGYSSGGAVAASFWDTQTSGRSASAGGTGKTTAQMKSLDLYVPAGWGSYPPLWTIDDGHDYPRLAWQNLPGQPIFAYAGGAGTPADPFLIATPAQLQGMGARSQDWSKSFKLIADIDLSAYDGQSGRPVFNIIGYYNPDHFLTGYGKSPFVGTFDGNAHTIANFTWSQSDRRQTYSACGLFGYVSGASAQIKNLILLNPSVNAGPASGVGTLVGNLGGGKLTASASVGGSAQGGYSVGGLVGINQGSISNCYASTTASGVSHVGGLVGGNYYGAVSNSYAAGPVSGASNIGGLLGYSSGGAVSASFWDTQTTGRTTSAGGTGKTTAQMKTRSTFTGAGALWDFLGESANGAADIWTICEGTNYPRFVWQVPPADFLCPDGVGVPELAYLADHWLEVAIPPDWPVLPPPLPGLPPPPPPLAMWSNPADLNQDGRINLLDWYLLASQWLTGLP